MALNVVHLCPWGFCYSHHRPGTLPGTAGILPLTVHSEKHWLSAVAQWHRPRQGSSLVRRVKTQHASVEGNLAFPLSERSSYIFTFPHSPESTLLLFSWEQHSGNVLALVRVHLECVNLLATVPTLHTPSMAPSLQLLSPSFIFLPLCTVK